MPGDRLPKPLGCGCGHAWLFGLPCPGHGRDCPWHAYWRLRRQEREAALKEPGR